MSTENDYKGVVDFFKWLLPVVVGMLTASIAWFVALERRFGKKNEQIIGLELKVTTLESKIKEEVDARKDSDNRLERVFKGSINNLTESIKELNGSTTTGQQQILASLSQISERIVLLEHKQAGNEKSIEKLTENNEHS